MRTTNNKLAIPWCPWTCLVLISTFVSVIITAPEPGDDLPPVQSTEMQDDLSLSRQKRTLRAHPNSVWTKGIIPYTGSTYKDQMALFERSTCIRFKEWKNNLGKYGNRTTNEEEGLDHSGYLNFVGGGSCISHLGNRRNGAQDITCCGGITCIHELGHAMGAYHEQQNPLERGLLRLNRENAESDKQNNFVPLRPDEILSTGYDSESVMHYWRTMFSKDGKDTSTPLSSELIYGTAEFYYLMMEVSLHTNCQGLYCSDVKMKCVNDGYLTLVDGKCACRCPHGLDPATGCAEVMKKDSYVTTKGFPSGNYGLPAPSLGCSDGNFIQESISHPLKFQSCEQSRGLVRFCNACINSKRYGTCDDPQPWLYNMCVEPCNWCWMLNTFTSKPFDLAGKMEEQLFEHKYCVRNGEQDFEWPPGPGSFCIQQRGGSCPKGFDSSSLQLSQDVTLNFCCRDGGFHGDDHMKLPINKPFALYANGGKKCPTVQGMVATREYVVFNAFNKLQTSGTPVGKNVHGYNGYCMRKKKDRHQYEFNYCYYTQALVDCGGEIELTLNNPEAEISVDVTAQGKYCHWIVRAPEGHRIHLEFNKYDIQNSDDFVQVRYDRLGQFGIRLHADFRQRTFTTINNTLMLTHGTQNNSPSSFKATVSLLRQGNLCYKFEDKGASYGGDRNYTRPERPCIPWAQAIQCITDAYPLTKALPLLRGGSCRTLGPYDQEPWCFTDVWSCKRDYCDVCDIDAAYDKDKNCGFYASMGMCEIDTGMMRKCAKTCGDKKNVKCGRPDDVEGAELTTTPEDSYSAGDVVRYKCNKKPITSSRRCLYSGQWSPLDYACKEDCADHKTKCATWAAEGWCDTVHTKACPLSCGECGATPDCKDTNSSCSQWKSAGWCGDWRNWMKKKCPKACGECREEVKCGKPDDVKDAKMTTPAKDGYSLGDLVAYQCNNGQGTSTQTRRCLTSGEWTSLNYACTGCPDGWESFDGNCYTLIKKAERYGAAKIVCEGLGAVLSPAKTPEENKFLKEYRRKTYVNAFGSVWIAATDTETEGVWKWDDNGEEIKNIPWANGQPDDWHNEDCAVQQHSGNWEDRWCNHRGDVFWFYCKKPRAIAQTTCQDFADTCSELFADNINICSQSADFKELCKKTCGVCQSAECQIEAPSANVQVEGNKKVLALTEAVEYQCKPGFANVSGDARRACQANGQITGQPLVCVAKDGLEMTMELGKFDSKNWVSKKYGFTGNVPAFRIPRNGQIIRWEYSSLGAGEGAFQVWRGDGNNKFKLIGQNIIKTIEGPSRVKYVVPEAERITAKEGDFIGVYADDKRMGVTYKKCNLPGYEGMKYIWKKKVGDFKIGTSYDFTNDGNCYEFAVRAVLGPKQ